MATTIDWGTKVITVQQADLIQVQTLPIEIYQLNLATFHNELRDLEDDALGMPHDVTHDYRSPTTLSGVTYAQLINIINGYTVTFLPDSPWVAQIVGGNSNVGDVVNPNNVSVQTANSAGLQDAESLQAASFGGHVTIDVVGGIPGTVFPIGTEQTPVNNMIDAHAIAEARGIHQFLVRESLTLTGVSLADGYTFYADKLGTTLTVDPSCDLTNASFKNISVTGVLTSGGNRFESCEVYDLTSHGEFVNCGFMGTLTLNGMLDELTQMVSCHSDVAGGGPGQFANIDMGGVGNDLIIRGYVGGLGIVNMNTATSDVSLDFHSGRLTLDSTVVDGTITVRGLCDVVDNSTGTAVVENKTINSKIEGLIGHIWAAS
jgi:hypothetical protein